MNADAHTNVFIMHTQTHTRKMHTDEQIQTHTKTYWQTSFRNRGKIPSFSTFGQIKCLAHTHTPLFLIYRNATPQQIQSEWSLCFFFLPICCFIFLLVLPLLPYNTHIYNIHTFLSQLEPNNFSLNGPTG